MCIVDVRDSVQLNRVMCFGGYSVVYVYVYVYVATFQMTFATVLVYSMGVFIQSCVFYASTSTVYPRPPSTPHVCIENG